MKKEIKGFILGCITTLIITSGICFAASYTATPNTFPVKVNNRDAQLEGYNIDGSTYFKLRDIGDRMGFDVGFENNTIYIGTVPEPSNDIAYYPEPYNWCPDFGKYTNTTLSKEDSGDFTKLYMYNAEKNDFQKYASLLAELGYQRGFVDGDRKRLAYVKDDCVIEMALTDNLVFAEGIVSIILVRGEWATKRIVPERETFGY